MEFRSAAETESPQGVVAIAETPSRSFDTACQPRVPEIARARRRAGSGKRRHDAANRCGTWCGRDSGVAGNGGHLEREGGSRGDGSELSSCSVPRFGRCSVRIHRLFRYGAVGRRSGGRAGQAPPPVRGGSPSRLETRAPDYRLQCERVRGDSCLCRYPVQSNLSTSRSPPGFFSSSSERNDDTLGDLQLLRRSLFRIVSQRVHIALARRPFRRAPAIALSRNADIRSRRSRTSRSSAGSRSADDAEAAATRSPFNTRSWRSLSGSSGCSHTSITG